MGTRRLNPKARRYLLLTLQGVSICPRCSDDLSSMWHALCVLCRHKMHLQELDDIDHAIGRRD